MISKPCLQQVASKINVFLHIFKRKTRVSSQINTFQENTNSLGQKKKKHTIQKLVCSNRIHYPCWLQDWQTSTERPNKQNKRIKTITANSYLIVHQTHQTTNLIFLILLSGRLLQMIWLTRDLEKQFSNRPPCLII